MSVKEIVYQRCGHIAIWVGSAPFNGVRTVDALCPRCRPRPELNNPGLIHKLVSTEEK